MQAHTSLQAAGYTLSAGGRPFRPGTTTLGKIDFFHDEIYYLLKDYKHTFLGHGSQKEDVMKARCEPYRTTLTPRGRGAYKSRAVLLIYYLESVLEWAREIDEDLAEEKHGEHSRKN
jgi:hypothetical protein